MVTAAAVRTCTLCTLPAPHPLYDEAGNIFCCPACREVHGLIGQQDDSTAAPTEIVGETATAEITLGGLWCSSCAWLIGETLQRTPGVSKAEVSFVRREARVTYDPARLDPRKLPGKVRRLGYRAWLAGESGDYDEEERHFDRLLIGGVFAEHAMMGSIFLYIRQVVQGSPPQTEWLAHIVQIMILMASVPVLFIFGLPILRAGIAGLARGRPNMHALIALGALAAFGLSLANFIQGSNQVYFDTASMLLFLVAIGRWLEIRAQKSSREAVDRLFRQIPHEAALITRRGERRVSAETLKPGARVRVRPGERFPVDGIIALGEGDVDESLLTGEPTPVVRRPGERALAGSISMDGGFEVITTATGAQTTAGQIGKLLHQALWDRAPVQQLADRLAALMVPVAVLIAAVTFAYWSLTVDVQTGLLNALSVLLIACPCALGLATPLTLWIGVGKAAQSGAILRSGAALEELARARQVFFDKTGTLTRRDFHVRAVHSNGIGHREFLRRAGAVESLSEHPLGAAVAAAVREAGLSPEGAEDFRALPGQGVSGVVDGVPVLVGSSALMQANDLHLPDAFAPVVLDWQRQGLSVVYAGWEGKVRGLVGLGEQTRPDAVEAVEALKSLTLDVTVLTGDDLAAGERWTARLGVPVRASLRPEDKIDVVRAASSASVMIGDGINDGPALAAAGVGLALSDGTDVARAAADVILIGDDLRAVPWLIRLSRQTLRRVRQNLAWALVYNVIGIGLAAAGLLQPVLAAMAMVLSSALVTTNALHLRRFPNLTENTYDIDNMTALETVTR